MYHSTPGLIVINKKTKRVPAPSGSQRVPKVDASVEALSTFGGAVNQKELPSRDGLLIGVSEREVHVNSVNFGGEVKVNGSNSSVVEGTMQMDFETFALKMAQAKVRIWP